MSFAPYHNLQACHRLEKIVNALHTNGNVPPDIHAGFIKFHFALLHKLQSAKHHLDNLEGYLNSQNAQQANPKEVVYHVNFHFDGFLYVLGSALDILAHEILCYYNQPLTGNIYYHIAHQRISAARPGDSLLPILIVPAWKAEFSDYRNCATHELVISTNYQVNVAVVGGAVVKKVVVPLPDDPRAPTLQYNKNKDIVAYCQRTFKRVLSLTNQIYDHVERRASANNALPI